MQGESESGDNAPVQFEVPVSPPMDTSNRCPYGHIGSVFTRYGKERVCAKCGVRVDAFAGREID